MFRGLINFLHISLPLPLFQHRSESIRRVINRKIYSSIVLNTPESSKKSSKIYTTNVPRELNLIRTRGKYRCVKILRVYERDPP